MLIATDLVGAAAPTVSRVHTIAATEAPGNPNRVLECQIALVLKYQYLGCTTRKVSSLFVRESYQQHEFDETCYLWEKNTNTTASKQIEKK